MAQAYIGQMIPFAGNFAIRGWAFCSAQLLSIAQNTALFSILGTTYGGDGRVTFGLPDLRGRSAVSAGQGPGLPNYVLGEMTGSTTVTLSLQNLPSITNILVPCSSQAGTVSTPDGNIPAVCNNPTDLAVYNEYSPLGTQDGYFSGVIYKGQNLPFDTTPPLLAINWLICQEGLFPPRS